jgi:dienelactone hydrolase
MPIFNLPLTLVTGLCSIFLSSGNNFFKNSLQIQIMESAKSGSSIKTEEVNYLSGDKQSKGFIAYDENRKEKLPVVIIVHEWWGLNDYTKSRAKQMAELGYFAFDADLFGNGKNAANPDEARALTKPYYSNPELTLQPIEAVIAKASAFPQADMTRIAAMGYCFGGFVALNAAKLGAPLKGIVSFHGRLIGVPIKKGVITSDILICQGGADEFVPEADQIAFKKSMDSVGAHYSFISYPGAKHAYTNPEATALGIKFNMPIAYNGSADSASWKDMQAFFLKVLK